MQTLNKPILIILMAILIAILNVVATHAETQNLVPTGDYSVYFNQQTLLYAIFWITFILGIAIVMLVFGFGLWYMTYRIKVRYYQIIGVDKYDKEILRFIGTDKAKLVKLRGGIHNLRFFWKRRKIEPPPSEAYLPTKKGYEIHIKTNQIDFDPMILRANPGFETIPMHKRLWHIQTQKQALEQYSKPSFWEKYGTLILTFGTIILCLAAMGFTIWYAYKLGVIAVNAGAANTAKSIASRGIIPGA